MNRIKVIVADDELFALNGISGIIEKSEDFFADGLIDSFDLTRLIAALEEAYDINIGGNELKAENFKNLEAIRALLERCGAQ